MPNAKRPPPEPLATTDEERDAYHTDVASDAWMEFILNSQPSVLAKYLRAGGPVDDQVRTALIAILENDPRGNAGGAKPFRDYETYVAVKSMVTAEKLARSFRLLEGLPPLPGRALSKRQAQIRYADLNGRELRAVEKQYERGKKISKSFQKVTNIP